MHKDWVTEDDLISFLGILADFCGYEFSELDSDAILYGIEETDYEKNKWYEYIFEGKDRAEFRLSQDVGTAVIFFEIRVKSEIQRKSEIALYVLDYLRNRPHFMQNH